MQFVQAINESAFDDPAKAQQLKWVLLFQIESGNLTLINKLEDIPFMESEGFELIAFVCDGLHKLAQEDASLREKINRGLQHARFVDYMLRYVSFQVEFEPSLEKLLQFDLTEAHEVSLRSKLATIALLKWDEEALLQQLEPLAAMPPEAYTPFAVNPFLLLSYLYQHFKGGTIDQRAIRELNALPYRLPVATTLAAPFHIDVLVYLYIKVSGNTEVAAPYHELVKKRLETINPMNRFELDLESLISAFFTWETDDRESALPKVGNLSLERYANSTYHLLYVIFQLQAGRSDRDEEQLVAVAQRAIALCEARGFKLLEAYCRILILEKVPKEERLRHLNNLKFQFAAYGYMAGLGALSKKYG